MIMRFLPAIFIALILGFIGFASLEKDKKSNNPFVSKLIGQSIPQDPENIVSPLVFEKEKVTLVNFFASWCVPCRVEHVNLTRLKESRDIQLVGIAFKDSQENIQKFLKELGDPYDVILQDPESSVALTWGIHGAPETFIVDKDNIIRHNHAGPIMEDDLPLIVQKIEKYK